MARQDERQLDLFARHHRHTSRSAGNALNTTGDDPPPASLSDAELLAGPDTRPQAWRVGDLAGGALADLDPVTAEPGADPPQPGDQEKWRESRPSMAT